MAGIPLQPSIIYGPIFSRRLGRSFGVNLFTSTMKTCSFNCIYCQYGETTDFTLSPEKELVPTPEEVFEAVEKALRKPRSMDYLTFSGNGEPTIHPNFLEIVIGVRQLMDEYRPESKLALFSNSSMICEPTIQTAIQCIDAPFMKLDAGDEVTFQAINQPVEGVFLENIIQGLRKIKSLQIQSALVDGPASNVRGEAYQAWKAVLFDLRPQTVQIYSTERPRMSDDVKSVSPQRLSEIAEDLMECGLNVQAFWRE